MKVLDMVASRRYFGTDGVRGFVGKSPMTPDFVMRLAYAAGRVLVDHTHHHPSVLIGKDTRLSGYMLEAAMQAGFCAAGVHVYLTGPLPTPAIAYLTRALRLSAGVMISASHNLYHDNGIKFFSEGGLKLDDALELDIEKHLEQPVHVIPDHGRAKRIKDVAGRYIEFCKSTFPNEMDLHGIKIVIDCANGAAYDVAPKVFHELGAEVITIGCNPDGRNINEGCGATSPEYLQQAVLQHHADYGIALDGDADRIIMIDRHGRIHDGDRLLYVLAKSHQYLGYRGGVVGTLMTNLSLEHRFDAMGIDFVRAKVGDRYVLEQLYNHQWLIGGETSGHVLCLDKHSTGDGIIAALQVFASLKHLNQDLSELMDEWLSYPQLLVNVPISDDLWRERAQDVIQEAEQELRGKGRLVLRPSGTEPVLRIMVESNDTALNQYWVDRVASVLQ
jgi:phosphoglucosamine mutase